MTRLSLLSAQPENSKYNEIQLKDNQMMILEIICQKVVNEISLLLDSIETYKCSLNYLKEYEEKKDLLFKITHLSGLENDELIYYLRTCMVRVEHLCLRKNIINDFYIFL